MENYRIGVDLGGTNMVAGLIGSTGKISEKLLIKTRKNASPEQLASDMTDLIHRLCKQAKVPASSITRVGIGVPGSISKDGYVEDANNIGFVHVPFGEMMQEKLNLPVRTINDAQAAALGEYTIGAGRGSHSFQMVTIGTGIGGAYIIDGRVISGCNGAAGEIGHMVIAQNGLPCNCGRCGCFEVYASASALREQMCLFVSKNTKSLLWELCKEQTQRLSGKLLFEALLMKDQTAQVIFEQYIEYLSEGIANIINMLQPEILCIGGGMSEQKDALLVPLRETVEKKIYSRHSETQTQIVAAELGNAAGIIGAVL